jgi:beta-N-acetylhexosaminidase
MKKMQMKLKWLGAGSLMAAWVFAGCQAWAAPAPQLHLDRKGERWAARTLHKMSLDEKVGQLIMVWAKVQFLNVESPDYLHLRDEMTKYHVGGFGVTVATDGPQLLKSEPLEVAALTNRLQKSSKYPLIFAADFERGLSMRFNGATAFPAAMAFGAAGDANLAKEFGRISALESRAIGIQWNWFPVADVNSNPANPIIDTRSFGEDPVLVSKMVDAYIEGAHRGGMLTTVKHFPGHGDTDTDSHLSLARVNVSMDRLNAVELVPFRNAITAGVDSVMVGHLLVPAIEPDPNRPASISAKVVTGLLKEKLGFHGLVVTDALDMAGLTKAFTGSEHEIAAAEAVAALQAGSDMIIIPGDLDGAANGLLNAVKSGEISQKRIDESVFKILRMKALLGLNHNRFIDLSAVEQEVARPENQIIAQKAADEAVTLVADAGRTVPLSKAAHAPGIVAVFFADRVQGSEGGRAFAFELRKRAPDARIFFVDTANESFVQDNILEAVKKSEHVIAVAEAFPDARRTTEGRDGGSAGLDSKPLQLLSKIVQTAGGKTIVAAFGNPYTGGSIPGIQTYVCTFSNTPASAVSLVSALFGEIPIHGRLPVTIPGFAKRGAGLDREALAAGYSTVKSGAQN